MIVRTKRFRFWHSDNGSFELVIINKSLLVNIKIPYPHKWIELLDSNNKVKLSKLYSTTTTMCELDGQSSGKYSIQLYGSHNGINYDGYIGGKRIIIEQDNTHQWFFVLPRFTLWNRELLKTDNLNFVYYNTMLNCQHTMLKAARRLTANCYSIRDKVLVIHDFVANNLYYDYDSLKLPKRTNRTIEQIVRERKGVCQGYADLTLMLLKSLGIQTENILCYALSSFCERGWSEKKNRDADLNHVITRAKLEDRWLYMDVTWDSHNKYENGKYIRGREASHIYFDVTIPFLSTTHRFFKKSEP